MKILFDTSVLVAGLATSHSRHSHAFAWLKRAKAGEFESLVRSPSLAELYSVLTSLPVKPRLSPMEAIRLIGESVQKIFSVVPLATSDYTRVLQSLAERNLAGGINHLFGRRRKCAAAARIAQTFAHPESESWISSVFRLERILLLKGPRGEQPC